jgi:hypothetical protein
VANGSYTTPSISPRAALVLRLHIVVAQGSASSATLATTLEPSSGTPRDAVRAAVTAH